MGMGMMESGGHMKTSLEGRVTTSRDLERRLDQGLRDFVKSFRHFSPGDQVVILREVNKIREECGGDLVKMSERMQGLAGFYTDMSRRVATGMRQGDMGPLTASLGELSKALAAITAEVKTLPEERVN